MSNWYVVINSESKGPYTAEQIKQLLQSNQINQDTLIHTDVSKTPVALKSVKEFQTQSQSNLIDEQGLCPVCGYFAGALFTCPRCGARVEKRISLRIIKIGAVVGSIIGIILLWIAAYAKQPLLVNIGDIDEKMNGALVKIVGKVVSYEEMTDKNSLRMKIDDGTGQMSVSAFNKLAQLKKVFKENMPALGDKIEVIGSLSETQKFGLSMFLSVPERLKIVEKYQIKEPAIEELKKENVGDIVKLKVFVSSYEKRTTKKGTVLNIFTLSDKTGSISMTIFDKEMEKIPAETKELLLGKGNELEMVVTIDEYRGALQAKIVDYTKVKKIGTVDIERVEKVLENTSAAKQSSEKQEAAQPAEEIKEYTFAEIKDSDIGKKYKFEATVKFCDQKKKGMIVTLDDGSGKNMKLMIWDNVKGRIKNGDKIKKGATITGIFEISEFKNKPQLAIKNPNDIKVKSN